MDSVRHEVAHSLAGVSDAMIESLFSALGTSRGTVDIDTFLQWLFQDQLP